MSRFHQLETGSDLIDHAASALGGMFSRRDVLKRAAILGLSVPLMGSLLAACGDDDADEEATAPAGGSAPESTTEDEDPTGQEDEPRRGGTLKVALASEPPTLDVHQTTTTGVSLVTLHMCELLFTWDEEFQIIPELAERYEVSDDGLVNTVYLRQGVPFHNGEELVADDVVASVKRWLEVSSRGASLAEATESIEAVDDYTVEFHMNQSFGTFATTLARIGQACVIYPASVIEAAGPEPITDIIGTGPYKFVERQIDQRILLERFEDYVSPPMETTGYGGRKNQYVDAIEFLTVPDEAARIAGLQAGDFDYLESVSADQHEALAGNPDVVAEIPAPDGFAAPVLNTREGILSDIRIRQALQAALDHEPILIAGLGADFIRLSPGLMLDETVWASDAGAELYNRRDPETARQILDEVGYDGTPIRILTTQEYAYLYNFSVVIRQQLEEAGFVIDLQVYDWATIVDLRNRPEAWDIFMTDFSFLVDPTLLLPIQSCEWPGWWCSEEKMELAAALHTETDFETRYDILEQIQALFYEEVPLIKLGDMARMIARSPRIKNFVTPVQLQPAFWNVWLET